MNVSSLFTICNALSKLFFKLIVFFVEFPLKFIVNPSDILFTLLESHSTLFIFCIFP